MEIEAHTAGGGECAVFNTLQVIPISQAHIRIEPHFSFLQTRDVQY